MEKSKLMLPLAHNTIAVDMLIDF